MMGTGGGSPEELQLSDTENAILNFLSADASGLSNISEGGLPNNLQENVMPSNDYDETLNSSALSYNIEENDEEDTFSQTSNDAICMESYKMYSPIQEKHNNNVQSINVMKNTINSVCIENF